MGVGEVHDVDVVTEGEGEREGVRESDREREGEVHDVDVVTGESERE